MGSKPEAIRQALIEYFNKLDEQQLRRARLRLLEEQGYRNMGNVGASGNLSEKK